MNDILYNIVNAAKLNENATKLNEKKISTLNYYD